MKCLRRISVFICFASTLCAWTQQSPPTLRVTIIAVSNFEDPELSKDTNLTTAISKTALDLKAYFEEHFSIPVTLFDTHDKTTDGKIRGWLFDQLRVDSDKSINLIFVLTHGFANLGIDKKSNDSEIYLATSNTYEDKPSEHAIRGMELLEAIGHAPKRNTYFLFIDSCGSGAIDSDMLQNTLQANPGLASRLMILASSMQDEKSYRARFTEALRRIWSTTTVHCSQENLSGCHCGEAIQPFLTSEIKKVPGASPDVAQEVRLVTPSFPDFCIELFNTAQRVLFLFNAAPGDTQVTLQTANRDIPPLEMRRGATRPLNLNADKYTLIAKRVHDSRDTSSTVIPVDLKSSAADVEVLFGNELDKASANVSASLYLQTHEIAPGLIQGFEIKTQETFQSLSEKLQQQLALVQSQTNEISAQFNSAASQTAQAAERVRREEAIAYRLPTGVLVNSSELAAARNEYQSRLQVQKVLEKRAAEVYQSRYQLDEDSERLIMTKNLDLQLSQSFSSRQQRSRALFEGARQRWQAAKVDRNRVMIPIPYVNSLAKEDLKKVADFVASENLNGDVQVEIEVPSYRKIAWTHWTHSGALDTAQNIREQLKNSGLQHTLIAARTYFPPDESGFFPSDVIRLILSIRWPDDFEAFSSPTVESKPSNPQK